MKKKTKVAPAKAENSQQQEIQLESFEDEQEGQQNYMTDAEVPDTQANIEIEINQKYINGPESGDGVPTVDQTEQIRELKVPSKCNWKIIVIAVVLVILIGGGVFAALFFIPIGGSEEAATEEVAEEETKTTSTVVSNTTTTTSNVVPGEEIQIEGTQCATQFMLGVEQDGQFSFEETCPDDARPFYIMGYKSSQEYYAGDLTGRRPIEIEELESDDGLYNAAIDYLKGAAENVRSISEDTKYGIVNGWIDSTQAVKNCGIKDETLVIARVLATNNCYQINQIKY